MKNLLSSKLNEHIEVFKSIKELESLIYESATLISNCFKIGGKVIFCGNGGSASDCQHIAAEFVGKFHKERVSLPAISLTSDSSVVTAIANDYGFENIFSRQIQGLANENDILFCITTSGNSENITNALKEAKNRSLKSILLTSIKVKNAKGLANLEIKVNSKTTARIQESHIFIGHSICELVELLALNLNEN